MAFSIEDVNSRTILQQFHKLYERQNETEQDVENLDTKIDQEIQDRTNADIGLSDQIGALQSQLDSLGTIFTLKGSVATVDDLPSENNHVGDVWYVQSVSSGYIWIDDNGTERWEQLGVSVDMSNYPTNEDLSTALAGKQDTLTAGTNISIIDNVISAAGGNNNAVLLDNSTQEFDGAKVLFTKSGGIKFRDKTNSTDSERYAISITPQNPDLKIYDRSQNSFSIGCDYSLYARFVYKGKEIKLPDKSGTIALTSDIKKLYRHEIKIIGDATATIITDDATAFTAATLAQWLYDNGFRRSSTYKTYPLKIAITASNNALNIPLSIYNNSNNSSTFIAEVKNITFTTDGTNVSISATSQGNSISSIEDNITEIL